MDKNLKDTKTNTEISLTDMSFSVSYTKTHKLITALYMVTDIIDKEEPIRNKLRNLGAEIISDMHSFPSAAGNKIAETVSFLNIASAMNFISEMNCTILKKEFLELKLSIQEGMSIKPRSLVEFFENPPLLDKEGAGGGNSEITTSPFGHSSSTRRRGISQGHKGHTRLGVQKGSTLMQALSNTNLNISNASNFDVQKKQRQNNIISVIKNKGGNAGIKDILNQINTGGQPSLSEKTLQRELVSMTKDGVLNKNGEKRWSRYSIKV